jgi:hypothetical protein
MLFIIIPPLSEAGIYLPLLQLQHSKRWGTV